MKKIIWFAAVISVFMCGIALAAGTPGSAPVTVINTGSNPVPVAVVPSSTPQSQFFSQTEGMSSLSGDLVTLHRLLIDDVVLKGLSIQAQKRGSADSKPCMVFVSLVPGGGGDGRSLASALALGGNGPVVNYLPLPDVYVFKDDVLKLEISNGDDGEVCYVHVTYYGIKPGQ